MNKKKLSEEHKKKISRSITKLHKKKGYTPAWNKGLKTSEDVKEKQRQAKLKNPTKYWLGKKRPEFGKLMSKINSEREHAKGKKSLNWKGGTSGWFRKEARNKMEQKIKRKLNGNEVVHHIDGNWKNNKLNNLIILTRGQHCKVHKLSRWI